MAPKSPAWKVAAVSTAIVGFGVGGFAIARAADSGDGPELRPVQLEQGDPASVQTPTPSVASLDSPAVVTPEPVPPPQVQAPPPPAPSPPPAPAPVSVDDSWSVASPASADSVDDS